MTYLNLWNSCSLRAAQQGPLYQSHYCNCSFDSHSCFLGHCSGYTIKSMLLRQLFFPSWGTQPGRGVEKTPVPEGQRRGGEAEFHTDLSSTDKPQERQMSGPVSFSEPDLVQWQLW